MTISLASNATPLIGFLRSSRLRGTRAVSLVSGNTSRPGKRLTIPPPLFLPLEFEPGQDAQVDWGEAIAILNGQRQKVQFFVMHLCYSRRTYAACFPSQNQESFLWAHVQAFRHFGGVPHRLSYDNLATAVKLVFDKTRKRGRSRKARASVHFLSQLLPV